MTFRFDRNHWALILGGSSGFGLATARKLAAHGMSIAVVHRSLRGAMPEIQEAFREIERTGVGFVAYNVNALSGPGQALVLDGLTAAMEGRGRVRALVHSIAYGNLKPLAAPRKTASVAGAREPKDAVLEDEDFDRTVRAMGTSLATWTQALHARGLFAKDARVFGLTSEGNEVAWRGYAAVAAAKAALESITRSIAVEMGPYGIRANVLQPGVANTPALRLIPGAEGIKARAKERNPLGRLTTPADVADAICLLCTDEAQWINGALLRVDGGERVSG